jgi:superfamily II DNA or RNA helicase
MLTPNLLHDYQKRAVNHQCTRPHSMLWLDMGLGKTIVTLTSIAHLIGTGFLRGVVIVAPIRVIRLVWRQEAAKWEHTKHLRFSMMTGTRDQRTRALLRPADIWLINYENLGWMAEVLDTYFVSKGKPMPFNGVVWDEISKMKNSTTNRVKAVRKVLPAFDWTTGLTGTPASNGYKDLHGQFLVVDKGQRLGVSKTAFKTRFYKKAGPYKEVPYPDTEETIKNLIGDITLEMSAEDYNKLPDLIVNNVEVEMPDEVRSKYEQMEREFFTVLDSGKELEVFNSAALTNKCLQFSNGAVYPVAGMPLWEPVHDAKLDALEEIIDEAQGSPVLCAYAYRSDAERIMQRFKSLDPINLTECKSEGSLTSAMVRWKSGQCALMIGHPACLHPKTEVLTQLRGWVKIVDVLPTDCVFDGVEYVSHSGCSYSGYKEVIEVFGVKMTPNHRLLIADQWVQAKDVDDPQNPPREALFRLQVANSGVGEVCPLRDRIDVSSAERGKTQSEGQRSLRVLRCGHVPQPDGHPDLEDLAGHESTVRGYQRQKLRGSGDQRVSRVGQLRAVLRRHVRRLLGRPDDRARGCQQAVQQGQLPLGDQHGAAVQQAEQPICDLPGREDAPRRVGAPVGLQQDDADHASQPRDDRGSSRGGCSSVTLRQGEQSRERSHVYDLVNCGPHHRFLIRNEKGEMFISHNSMGHGIDGLQHAGRTLVWFGLNWSLDLYEQFNARVRRQGQGASVVCHHIMCRDTLDQAQAIALNDKATTQAGLRAAVKQYRKQRGV